MCEEELNLPDDVEQLRAIIAERNAVIDQHVATIDQHETTIDGLHETIEQQLKKLTGLEQQLARLLRKQYGPQKERIDPNQLTLFTADELTRLAEELEQGIEDSVPADDGGALEEDETRESSPRPNGSPKPKGHGRRPLPDHLPREVVVHEVPENERACPCCGKPRCEFAREVSEQLEYVPASLIVVRHERIKYACDDCEENVVAGAKPPQPIAKGLPGPGLLAHTVLSKYGDYLPLYRQEDILSRSGLIIRRSTLGGWIAAVADLLEPLYHRMGDRVRMSHVIRTDDTGIKLLEPVRCRNCKFWTYVGDEANPYSIYEFSLTREGHNPAVFLEGFEGYLQADAFSGYDQVYARGKVIEVACMAHCRRYWWEAKDAAPRPAHEALSYIARLNALEEEFAKRNLTGAALRDARQRHAIPILDAFKAWLEAAQASVLPKSLIGRAFTYTLNQWAALCRYTEDGALSIDNNLAERQVKLPAIGRRNWLFVGSERGGHRAAILLSLIASAKLCQVEPWAWLNAVLTELPRRNAMAARGKPPDPDDLLPDVWLKAHPEHRWQIDDLRQKEREQSKQQKISRRKRN